jgi:hypothetical protein
MKLPLPIIRLSKHVRHTVKHLYVSGYPDGAHTLHATCTYVHLHTLQSQLLPSQMPSILLQTHTIDLASLLLVVEGSRAGQTAVGRTYVAPSVALVAWDLTTWHVATLPFTNSLRLLSSWDYRQGWVCAAMLPRTALLWDVILHHWVSGSNIVNEGRSFRTWGPTYTAMQCNIPEDSNPQHCFISTMTNAVTTDWLNNVLLSISKLQLIVISILSIL